MPLLLTPEGLATAGQSLVTRFCQVNNLVVPQLIELTSEDQLYYLGTCGFYRRNKIHVMTSKCARPGRGGMAWSWPGYVIDRTPYGVYAHELGHHCDVLLGEGLGIRSGKYWSDFSTKLMNQSGEPKLTNYCPNPSEWFAEMMRLFITNSDLLRCARPKTYKLLTDYLTPVVTQPWRKVLASAPERTKVMALKKIKEIPSA